MEKERIDLFPAFASNLIEHALKNDDWPNKELKNFRKAGLIREQLENLYVLQLIMTEGVACFSFVKKDGTKRQALGTRCQRIIEQMSPQASQTGSAARKNNKNQTVFTYYDIEKNDWRCFTCWSLENIDMNYVK